MSIKWSGSQSESGILRKSDFKEKKEELFVFGYSCKLFREDDRALLIDQGKHLIPWMGDETLKIDRYDARGALHELSSLEAPSGGYDWRVELTKAELDVEQLCDEERYRALHTNEDEEEMYKEEELKRLHAAGYGQVGFNYDAPAEPEQAALTAEVDEPFLPTPEFKALLPTAVVLPETLKQNAIIEKTAKFIASQGAQMEILIKAKQGDNPQFQFLNKDSVLHPYYSVLIGLIKSGKWPEKKQDVVDDKLPEAVDEYLHPSLASTVIESAPSIPSIHYKPSADCDYTMLISKMRGEAILDEVVPPELAPGEVAPPGTEPLPPRVKEIYHPPVLYSQRQVETAPHPTHVAHYQQHAAYYHHYANPAPVPQAPINVHPEPVAKSQQSTSLKSTGLSLMKNYNTDSDSDVSDSDEVSSSNDSKSQSTVITPPEEVQIVIEKMASYVARNGDEFADIVRAKNDPRFTFLEPDNMYYAFYRRLMQEKRGVANGRKNAKDDGEKWNVPVSFSIKKSKEPDPILPKPALPYETSSDEDLEKQGEKQEDQSDQLQNSNVEVEKTEKTIDKVEEIKPQPIEQQIFGVNNIPPIVVYKMEGQLTKDLPLIRTIEPVKKAKTVILTKVAEVKEVSKPEVVQIQPEKPLPKPPPAVVVKEKTPLQEQKKEERIKDTSPNHRREKRKHRERKKEYRSKSETRERHMDRSLEKEKRKEKESDRDKKKSKCNKDDLETEIISLEDDEFIDLTGEHSDSRGEGDVETDHVKQQERRRRAAEFLKKVGVDPSAVTLPTTSLASAMVDTLESIRRKKAEEEKRRRREKRRHRDRREDDSYRKSRRRKYRSSENEESDYDSSKKKRRKKEKKHSTKSKKKRRREEELEEGNEAISLNIDLTSTLKELRTYSPTKDLFLQSVDQNSQLSVRVESSEDDDSEEVVRERKLVEKKTDRQYSEGEWSSNSDGGSKSSKDFI